MCSMRKLGLVAGCGLAALSALARPSPAGELSIGPWRAWLDGPGGELPFGLELARDGDAYRAWLINGPSRSAVPTVRLDGSQLTLGIDHYHSKVIATISTDGGRLDGEWTKVGSKGAVSRLAFHAVAGHAPRFAPAPGAKAGGASCKAVDGRWRVSFSKSEEPAVGLLECQDDGTVNGTFLTTTGDYGYLAGAVIDKALKLSCFDGAHAFLFHATVDEDGALAGDFWSRDTWHETWTARRDPHAALQDAFTLTRWTGRLNLSDLAFTDLDGKPRTLADPAFAGRARIIEIFGSWCPNCHDAAALLGELHERYRARGLSIVGLAFEMTDDPGENLEQVRKYVAHHQVRYPVLLAGRADKDVVKEALPLLDRFRAYPTTIFVDRDGEVKAIHTGFSGPATGEAHQALRREFISKIEAMLGDGTNP